MNVLLSIGCDRYHFLGPLAGAQRDATAMFETLSVGGFYDAQRSKLLLSPSREEMEKSIASILRGEPIEVFTFVFAGHAGGKDGSFYLALPESEPDALSITSFPLSRLFDMVNEFKPRQLNVIIDGCEAGSSTSSLRTLLRPENVGTIHASSVAFLGACSADEGAGESEEGGALTTHLLKVIRGESDLMLQAPVIELTDISAYVSDAVAKEYPEQHPVFWALNLFGRGGFAQNPHFHISSPLPALSLTSVASDSAMGKLLSKFSTELWEEYRLASRDFDPARLLQLLRSLLAPPELRVSDRAAAVSGLLHSFASVAAAEGELLAQSFCAETCLIALLPWSDEKVVCELVNQELRLDFERTNSLLVELMEEFRKKENRLFGNSGLLSDLYYLPLRITRLLGLVSAQAIIARLLGIESDASISFHREFVSTLLATYPKLFVCIDDEQASPIYIFLKAAQLLGWAEEGIQVVEYLYFDAAIRKGVFNRLNTDGEGALEHLLVITESEQAMKNRVPANPSALLPVLVLGGTWMGCAQDWDLQVFDRRQIGCFFPDDYRDFSQKVIERGVSHTWQVGFGVWQPEQLFTEFENIVSSRIKDAALAPEAHCLCILASVLFPDRIPFNLEHLSRE
jgi:Caspase domain